MVGVYDKPPEQRESTDEAFLLQLKEVSHSQTLILMGDFNHPYFCWENNSVWCKGSGYSWSPSMTTFRVRYWTDSPEVKLMPTSVEEIIKDIKIGGSLGCSDHALLEFVILRKMDLAKCKVRALNLGRVNFRLFKELLDGVPWEAVFRDKGAELATI